MKVDLPKSVQKYCTKHQIKWNHERFDDYEFIAPPGNWFANESKYRFMEIEHERAGTIIDCLQLYEARE